MADIDGSKLKEALKLLEGNYDMSGGSPIGDATNMASSMDMSMETIFGLVLGTVMFSVGVLFIKKGKNDGMLVYVVSGLAMCIAPFLTMNPYIIVSLFVAAVLSIKYIDF